ncbi:MAG: tetratricopeptide repeat protein [Thermoanaerobaculia bacterium]
MSRRLAGFAAPPALLALLAVLLPLALYLPTLRFGFLFDDRPLLIDNPIVQAPRGIAELFTSDLDPRARLTEAPTTNYLRPLFLLVASGLYRSFGDSPPGWHAVALLLHAALGGLAFLALRRENVSSGSALAGSLLFSLHPSHVQSTAWISGIQDLLFAFFAFLAFLVYRASVRRKPDARFLVFLGAAYAAVLLAKEPAVGLLFFAVAAFLWRRSGDPGVSATRRGGAEVLTLSAVTAVYLGYRWTVLGTLAHAFPTAPRMTVALASVPVAILAYVRDLIWPVGLFLLHPTRPVPAVFSAKGLIAAIGVLLLAAAILQLVRRRPEALRPALWAVSFLVPVLALWAVNPEWMVMDRYLLLPSFGWAWGIVLLLPLEGPPTNERTVRRIVVGAAILAYALFSLRSMEVYSSEERFWAEAIRADPGSSTAWSEAGRLRAAAGDLAGAEVALERAVSLDPYALVPRHRRALLALRRGDVGAATAALQQIVDSSPDYLPAWRNLIVARLQSGDRDSAMRTLASGLARFPQDPVLWNHRAALLREEGRRDEALESLRHAIALAPRDAGLRLREALLLAELGRSDESATAARAGLALSPGPEVKVQLEPLAK